MEQLKKIFDELTDMDDDFYSMGVILQALEKAYPIEKNPEAFCVVHTVNGWLQEKKKKIEMVLVEMDDIVN